MKNKLSVKHSLIYVLEWIGLFIIFSVFSLIFTVGIENIDMGNLSTKDVEIVGSVGFEQDGEYWRSYNDDPSITVEYDSASIIELELSFFEDEDQYGVIFYASDPNQFTDEYFIPYLFQSGKNTILIDDENAKYLRLDITDQNNVSFKINTFQVFSPTSYALKSINYGLMVILATIFIILQILISKSNHNRIDIVFVMVLIGSIYVIFSKFICVEGYYMYSGIGSDTITQYYPYYLNEVLSIRNGTFSVWNWNYGLGTSIFNMNAWTMDPFGMLIVAVGVIFGPDKVQVMLVWMQITKIATLFLFGKKYMSYFLTDRLSINISAYLLAMNGYIMLWGQHYYMGTACIFTLMLLCAIENYLHTYCAKGGIWIVLATAWTLIYSYYIGYMVLACCAIYFLYRYFFGNREIENLKNVLKDLARTLYFVIVGIMISGIVFIPACYYVMTNSSRLSSVSNGIISRLWSAFCESFNFSDFSSRLSRFISNNALYIEDNSKGYFANYYEAPILFCTVLIFFFLGQWIIYEIKKAKEKKKWVSFAVKLILLWFLVFNSAAGFVLNAFAYSTYRYTFLLFPFFVLGIGIVFQEVILKNKISILGIEIASLLSAWGWGYSMTKCSTEVKYYIVIVGLVLLIGHIVFIAIRKNDCKKMQKVGFLVVMVVFSTALDNWYTTQERHYVKADSFSLEWNKSELSSASADALKWIREYDESFYRVEKMYTDHTIYSDSFIEGYSTVTWYNSTPNVNVSAFYNNIYTNAIASPAGSLFTLKTDLDQRANEIVHTKYLLSDNELDNDNWKLVHTVSGMYIYENQNSDNVAKWYCKTITKEMFETLEETEKANILQDTVVIDNSFKKELNESEANVGIFSLDGQTLLRGGVENTEEGVLLIAVPDQAGWNIYVDGEKKETVNCDYGFLGVLLESGSHEVVAKYNVPYGKEGVCVSVLGIVLLLIYVIFEKRCKKLHEQGVK